MPKAKDVADWFIARAAAEDDAVSHLKVQKLLYYSEAWSQALLDKELLDENIQAWAHGPVVPEVFQEFKGNNWQPLPVPEAVPDFSADEKEVLEQVYDTYGHLPAKTLEAMTHEDDPWVQARRGVAPEARCENVISKQHIKEFFIKKYMEDDGEENTN